MRLATLLLAFLVAGCGEEAPGGWRAVAPASFTDAQKAQQAQGLAAKDALFGGLLQRLQAAFAEDPAGAIAVCREAAPAVAQGVVAQHGVRIGRTSFKLRNPRNVPPAWAESHVAQRVEAPVWLAHDDGRLAALLPIPTKTMCLACHGGEAKIPEPIRAALREQYPEDQATGFTAGALRGWFWLEVPAAAKSGN